MPTNPAWSPENYAHHGTYIFLGEMGEINTAVLIFEKAGVTPLATCTYFAWGMPPEGQGLAPIVASRLYDSFVYYYRPNWQSRDLASYGAALEKLTAILRDQSKTIGDLGRAIDDIFLFSNETQG